MKTNGKVWWMGWVLAGLVGILMVTSPGCSRDDEGGQAPPTQQVKNQAAGAPGAEGTETPGSKGAKEEQTTGAGEKGKPAVDLEVTVMTFNIRYGTARDGENHWTKRRDLVFGVLQREKPDVVGLQEALRFQMDEIHAAVPGYAEVGVGRDDGKKKGEYSSILYRSDRFEVAASGTFWFSDTPEVPGSKDWGNRIPRICSWARLVEKETGWAFYHFNVHLDHQSQPSREHSAVLLMERVGQREHREKFVVTGDFNAGEANPAIRYIKGEIDLARPEGAKVKNPSGLLDSFRVVKPRATSVGTFGGFKGEREGEKIDYIFVPEGVTVLEADILHDNESGRYSSDHYPVTARIVFGG